MSIELKNVTYTYSPGTAYESHALKDVSLVIPDGQFIGIIGHTGSGKYHCCHRRPVRKRKIHADPASECAGTANIRPGSV